MTILELREKRAKAWEAAKAFLDSHRNDKGVLSAEDDAAYTRMEQEITDLGKEIARLERQEALDAELNRPVNKPLTGKPMNGKEENKTGRATDEYRQNFWNMMRSKAPMPSVVNALQIGTDSEGGYLVPDEYERTLVEALEEENVFRQLAKVIQTSSGDRKIPVVATKGTASWIDEEGAYTTEVRISTLDCSNFTNPYQMLEYTQMRLAEYAQPRVSYVLSAMDLSALTGYEHEAWALGDIVTVDDKDLNLSVKTRVVRRQYNLQEPWKTVLELSTTLRELGDSSAQWDKAADVLASTDVIDRQEVKDLVPFNHLRNSRADSGMNYWTNSGFEVDAENGVSGTASFKAEGVLGMTKSLTQTVYPASRRSYTFSAQIASEDLQKGPSGQVGIEVTFEYEDGSTETRFIDLF